MEKKNTTIKGTHASIYIHQIRKNYNYYALYVNSHRIGRINNSKIINHSVEELKELVEMFENESKKRIRLDAWPRKSKFTRVIDRPFKMVFEISWTNRLGEIEITTYRSKHCKLKYAKRKLNELYKYCANKPNIEQACVYKDDKIVYSKLCEV